MRRPRLIHDHRRAPARWLVLYFEPGGWRCCRSFGSEPDAEHAARRFAFSVARRQQVSEWPQVDYQKARERSEPRPFSLTPREEDFA